jgi:dienelactone hydrolase
MTAADHDPFARGRHAVGVRTFEAFDAQRSRTFPCELWYPAEAASGSADEQRDAPPRPGPHPLILFSHHSGGNRRSSSFLCRHLASHGYAVAAMDHSEVVAAQLARPDREDDAQRAARIAAIVASRVPDLQFLLDHLLTGPNAAGIALDANRVGLVGHSFGGWTVLATPEVEPRAGAVIALAPGGSEQPRPGILRLNLTFDWPREVPVLYLTGELDTPIPPEHVAELYRRTPSPKRMIVLRRADHQHFLDDVEVAHEAVRTATFPGEAAWIPAATLPITELSSGAQAHTFTRGLTLAHLDATLRDSHDARRFLDGDVTTELAARGVAAIVCR